MHLVWIWSASTVIWSQPNIESTSEKTRSDAADVHDIAKTIRAAFAHVGIVGWLSRHQRSSFSE